MSIFLPHHILLEQTQDKINMNKLYHNSIEPHIVLYSHHLKNMTANNLLCEAKILLYLSLLTEQLLCLHMSSQYMKHKSSCFQSNQ